MSTTTQLEDILKDSIDKSLQQIQSQIMQNLTTEIDKAARESVAQYVIPSETRIDQFVRDAIKQSETLIENRVGYRLQSVLIERFNHLARTNETELILAFKTKLMETEQELQSKVQQQLKPFVDALERRKRRAQTLIRTSPASDEDTDNNRKRKCQECSITLKKRRYDAKSSAERYRDDISTLDTKTSFAIAKQLLEEKFKRLPKISEYNGFGCEEWSHSKVKLPIDCWDGGKKIDKCYEIEQGCWEEGGYYMTVECRNRRKTDRRMPNIFDLDWSKNEWITREEFLWRNYREPKVTVHYGKL